MNKSVRLKFVFILFLLLVILLMLSCDNQNKVLSSNIKVLTDTAVLSDDSLSIEDFETLKQLHNLKTIDLCACHIDEEMYSKVKKEFPGCDIIWTVPFSASPVKSNDKDVSILTVEDASLLGYLTELKTITVKAETEDEALQTIKKFINHRDDIEILFQPAEKDAFIIYPSDEIDFSKSKTLSANEMSAILSLAKNSAKIHLDSSLAINLVSDLVKKYRTLAFDFPVEIANQEFNIASEELSVSQSSGITSEILKEYLPLFSNLKTVDLSFSEFSLDEIFDLAETFPEISFKFNLNLFGFPIDQDTENICLNGIDIKDISTIYKIIPVLKNLKTIEMCDCGIKDEDMNSLREHFPNVKIVWSVDLKHWKLRTDASHFATWRTKTDSDGYIVSARNIGGNTSQSLAPLQYCTDLVALDLGHNNIKDISFLSGLKNLKYLILALNKITDISPLSNLKELKYLEIFSNDIKDVSPLSKLDKLEALCMCNTPVDDISCLYGLTSLKRLYLQGYRFSDEKKKEIAKAFPDCEVIYKPLGSSGADWRKSQYYWEMREALGWNINP